MVGLLGADGSITGGTGGKVAGGKMLVKAPLAFVDFIRAGRANMKVGLKGDGFIG